MTSHVNNEAGDLKTFDIVVEHKGVRIGTPYAIIRGCGPGREEATQESRDRFDRELGAGLHAFVNEWIRLEPFKARCRQEFLEIEQCSGPPQAYYYGDDRRYTYQTFSWQSHDPEKIIARVVEFARSIKDAGQSIVWRRYPDFYWVEDCSKYFFSCRLHVQPYVELAGAKQEGEAPPEA